LEIGVAGHASENRRRRIADGNDLSAAIGVATVVKDIVNACDDSATRPPCEGYLCAVISDGATGIVRLTAAEAKFREGFRAMWNIIGTGNRGVWWTDYDR
jgi:hypothetical protein